MIKLNTNGANKSDIHRSGCGGVIRGCDGKWIVGFYKNLGFCNAFVAEMWSAFEGLEMAKNLGATKPEINVDSQSVVRFLHDENTSSHLAWKLIAKI